jgi:hypothetical protein
MTLSKNEIMKSLEAEAGTWVAGVTPSLDSALETGMRAVLPGEILIQVSVERLAGYEKLAPIAQNFALGMIILQYDDSWKVAYSVESKSLHFS